MDKNNTAVLRDKILRLKREKEAVILAHNYQIPQIQEIADYSGDSLELARISKDIKSRVIVFCGVKFMAETAKILSPHKKVILPVLEAGCPLAEMINPEQILALKSRYPGAWVVSYVNSTAQVKALSDVCCTSSNAVAVVKNIPVDKVIFVPDRNLGWWVQKNAPDKEIIAGQGFCDVHEQFTLEEWEESRKMYPGAAVMVHPECRKELLLKADFVLSTSEMLKQASRIDANQFIIGTEEGILYRLRKENPQKEFYSLGKEKVCLSMKKTTLAELLAALEKERYQIELDREVISKAKTAIERMISYT